MLFIKVGGGKAMMALDSYTLNTMHRQFSFFVGAPLIWG